MKDHRALHQRKGVIFPNLKDHGKLGKDALEIVVTLHAKKLDASNANAISQQIHVDEPDMAKGGALRATNQLCDDLLHKLKAKMDMLASEFNFSKWQNNLNKLKIVHACLILGMP